MISILSNPILRKLIAGVLTLAIGFYAGFTLKQKQLKSERQEKNSYAGKYDQAQIEIADLKECRDTLLNTVIALAMQERIKVDNHITDTKVKDGSSIHFVPKTKAQIIGLTPKPIETLKNSQPQPVIPDSIRAKKERKKRSWLRRLFTRKNKL